MTFMVSQLTAFHCVSWDTLDSIQNRVFKESFKIEFYEFKKGSIKRDHTCPLHCTDNCVSILSILTWPLEVIENGGFCYLSTLYCKGSVTLQPCVSEYSFTWRGPWWWQIPSSPDISQGVTLSSLSISILSHQTFSLFTGSSQKRMKTYQNLNPK